MEVLAGLTWSFREPVCSRFWHLDTRELGDHNHPSRKDVTIPTRPVTLVPFPAWGHCLIQLTQRIILPGTE